MSPQPPCLRLLVSLTAIFWLTATVTSQPFIENLPGFPAKLPFKLQTGYIGVGESEEIQLFYYFIESERSPENDPLFLWLTGGPGCSGLSALLYEIGPIQIDYANTSGTMPSLQLNPYSWTKVANIIFIDQPAGTGFSYAKTPEAYKCSDTVSAKLSYHFLKKWLINNPKYLNNPLYIAGVSYSGMTVPLVVDEIYNGIEDRSEPLLNIKGYILGNPITNLNGKFGEKNGRITYAHRMGLLSEELYKSVKENCKGDYLNIDPDNDLCKEDLKRVNECLDKIVISHILEPSCDIIGNAKRSMLMQHMPSSEDIARRFLESAAAPAHSWCRAMNMIYSTKWANVELAQKSLHVRQGTTTQWLRCNLTLKRDDYTYDVKSTVDYHKKLSFKDCRALIFSGDHDMVAPHTATEEWIKSLKLEIGSKWRPWFVEGQIAGYATAYFHHDFELTYATVRGAGHTAAEHKPMECLPMIERWLNHSPL